MTAGTSGSSRGLIKKRKLKKHKLKIPHGLVGQAKSCMKKKKNKFRSTDYKIKSTIH